MNWKKIVLYIIGCAICVYVIIFFSFPTKIIVVNKGFRALKTDILVNNELEHSQHVPHILAKKDLNFSKKYFPGAYNLTFKVSDKILYSENVFLFGGKVIYVSLKNDPSDKTKSVINVDTFP